MQDTIKKSNNEKKQAFGWASVTKDKNGSEITDRQGDVIDINDLEEPVYEYVLNFGDSGERHDPALRKKAKVIESVVFTKEKTEVMGIPEGVLPEGWWLGVQVLDSETWEKVRKGEYNMFSIEGVAKREPIEKKTAKSFLEIYKNIC